MTKLEVGHLILGGGEEDRPSGHRILNIKECEHVRIKISLEEENVMDLDCSMFFTPLQATKLNRHEIHIEVG